MKNILKDKEKLFALFVILIDFMLLCSIIYFKIKGNDAPVPFPVTISVLGTCLVFFIALFSKYKNSKLFLVPLFALILFPNNVSAMSETEILNQLYENSLQSEKAERICTKNDNEIKCIVFDLEPNFKLFVGTDYFGVYGVRLLSDYTEAMVVDIYYYYFEGQVFDYSSSQYSVIQITDNTDILLSSVDIYSDETYSSLYLEKESPDDDWGNIFGYTYISLEPEEQVILYPKERQIFNFTIYYNGYLELDFMVDSSDFSNSRHVILSLLPNEWVKRDDLIYTSEDARYKRVIYVSNSSYYGSSKFGYDPNLFDLYYLSDGKVTINDKEYVGNVSQIQDTYPEGELGVSEPLFGGSINDIVDNAPNLATQFIGVFEVIGALFSSFLSFMPPFIQNGLMLLFLAAIVITIIKIVRG